MNHPVYCNYIRFMNGNCTKTRMVKKSDCRILHQELSLICGFSGRWKRQHTPWANSIFLGISLSIENWNLARYLSLINDHNHILVLFGFKNYFFIYVCVLHHWIDREFCLVFRKNYFWEAPTFDSNFFSERQLIEEYQKWGFGVAGVVESKML